MKQKKTLIVEFGKFTGKQGLEVYERFEREVDDKWKKLQETKVRKSRAVGSRRAAEEDIIVKALDKFLTPLSARDRLKRETGQNISHALFNEIVEMDKNRTLKELRQMCRDKGLPISGDKKRLAWRLLR